MSRKSIARAIARESARTVKLAKIVPQLTAKRQSRIYAKTGKHRAQGVNL